MKISASLILILIITSCNEQNEKIKKLQSTVDSLQSIETYKPGFGEFMSGIQTHHAKLWFAGINQNWPLADFEIHEIQEALEDVQKFCRERPESKSIGMINPAIDSVSASIQQKDPTSFRRNFTLLTNTCNNCHKATEHAFNVVTIPAALPVSNQQFQPSANDH